MDHTDSWMHVVAMLWHAYAAAVYMWWNKLKVSNRYIDKQTT